MSGRIKIPGELIMRVHHDSKVVKVDVNLLSSMINLSVVSKNSNTVTTIWIVPVM